jgi:hypothetical protein
LDLRATTKSVVALFWAPISSEMKVGQGNSQGMIGRVDGTYLNVQEIGQPALVGNGHFCGRFSCKSLKILPLNAKL